MISPKITNLGYSNLWTDMSTILGYASNFDQQIQKLFANGEQGFAYDPNDLTTLYQDAVGIVPVTAAGQPVGLMKDKSGRNNHAFQTVSASRPILKQTPILGSELIVNGDFSNGLDGWNSALITATVENGRSKVTYTNGGGLFQDIPVTAGKTYLVSSKNENISGGYPLFYVYGSAGFSPVLASSGSSTPTLYVTAISSSIRVYLHKSGAGEAYWDDISVKELKGYRTDQNYLEFDGADDFLQTNSIDFTATDKVSLFTGVRKLSDAATGMVCELSTNSFSVDGSFYFAAPVTAFPPGADGFNLRGTTAIDKRHITISPASVMYTVSGDIGNKAIVFRTNGVTRVSGLADVGTGKLGNYPLYIGRRGGTSIPFNGHIYGLIGIGKLTSDDETSAIEKELAKRTGVTLNV